MIEIEMKNVVSHLLLLYSGKQHSLTAALEVVFCHRKEVLDQVSPEDIFQ